MEKADGSLERAKAKNKKSRKGEQRMQNRLTQMESTLGCHYLPKDMHRKRVQVAAMMELDLNGVMSLDAGDPPDPCDEVGGDGDGWFGV